MHDLNALVHTAAVHFNILSDLNILAVTACIANLRTWQPPSTDWQLDATGIRCAFLHNFFLYIWMSKIYGV